MKLLKPYLYLLTAMLATTLLVACGDDDDNNELPPEETNNINCNDTEREPALSRLEFPHVKNDGTTMLLIHTTNDQYGINYSVEWDIEKRAPLWSAYQMHTGTLKRNTTRYYSQTNQYPMDPLLPSSYYLSGDLFWNSGFSHGHVCPSADRLYSYDANLQTFYLTNMQPQYSMFNAGVDYDSPWCRLENKVRTWAASTSRTSSGQLIADTLYVVKGGTVRDDQLLTIIKGELRVPKYFFVAVLQKNQQGFKGAGFWLEHDSRDHGADALSKYVVNIRELEQLTGFDFFCNLPDDIEEHVETLPAENIIRAWNL